MGAKLPDGDSMCFVVTVVLPVFLALIWGGVRIFRRPQLTH